MPLPCTAPPSKLPCRYAPASATYSRKAIARDPQPTVTTTEKSRLVAVDESLVDEQFVRAPGPGGQNVNKVATAVQLRYDLARADMPADMRRRLVALAGHLMTQDGDLLIQANRYRSQAQNRIDARERLLELLRKASVRPRPRLATRPTAASRERRLDTKRHRSTLKRSRRNLDD